MTRDNAALFGLHDRGTFLPGMRADISVIDLSALGCGAPKLLYDMPEHMPQLDQRAFGFESVDRAW